MKNRHFIEIEEYAYFMENIAKDLDFDDDDFAELNLAIENAKITWEDEVVSNNYFISKLIDKLNKRKNFPTEFFIEKYYNLPNIAHFTIQECDHEFIESLMNNLPDQNSSIDDKLQYVIKSNPYV